MSRKILIIILSLFFVVSLSLNYILFKNVIVNHYKLESLDQEFITRIAGLSYSIDEFKRSNYSNAVDYQKDFAGRIEKAYDIFPYTSYNRTSNIRDCLYSLYLCFTYEIPTSANLVDSVNTSLKILIESKNNFNIFNKECEELLVYLRNQL